MPNDFERLIYDLAHEELFDPLPEARLTEAIANRIVGLAKGYKQRAMAILKDREEEKRP